MKRRYPLEALRSVRKEAAEERARAVALAAKKTAEAETAAERARRIREVEQARQRDVLSNERARLERGEARAGDLAREAGWALGAERVLVERRKKETEAAEQLAEKRRDEAHAQSALVRADADARAVDQHRTWWKKQLDARVERAEEEAAAEAWTARNVGGSGPRRGSGR